MSRFDLGTIVTTSGAARAFAAEERKKLPKGMPEEDAQALANLLASGQMHGLIKRHHAGDWGDLGEEDKQRNEEALLEGSRIFSNYQVTPELKVYVITEADRSSTTLLLFDEY